MRNKDNPIKNNRQRDDQMPNVPRRLGRRVIGDPETLFGSNKSLKSTRKIGDFSRSSGYYPLRPSISKELDGKMGLGTQNKSKQEPNLQDLVSGTQSDETNPKKRSRLFNIKLLIIPVLASVAVLMFFTVKGFVNLSKIFGSSSSISENQSPNSLKVEGDGRINILLLGIGGDGHDGPDLTDTIMLASIDPVNHRAGLLSIPRDLWVTLKNSGGSANKEMKLNAVYETGLWSYNSNKTPNDKKAIKSGFNLVNQTIGNIIGIPVKNDILLNFKAFQEGVDTLGGVNINVPSELYDPTIAWQNDNNPVIALKGPQTFSGAQALLYVRSRETSSDFARNERQRQVMLAMKDKILSAGTASNPAKLSSLSDEFGNNVQTSLSLKDIAVLYGITKKINNEQIKSIGLVDPPNIFVTTDIKYGQSIVRPISGYNRYSDIQDFVRNTFRDSYLEKENAGIAIINESSDVNLANNEANTLKSYGYRITQISNLANKATNSSIIDLTGGADKYTLHYLKLRLGLKVKDNLPSNSGINPDNANFVIILGEDEAINSKN
jgi:LCP family protein required for cell wall assembly